VETSLAFDVPDVGASSPEATDGESIEIFPVVSFAVAGTGGNLKSVGKGLIRLFGALDDSAGPPGLDELDPGLPTLG